MSASLQPLPVYRTFFQNFQEIPEKISKKSFLGIKCTYMTGTNIYLYYKDDKDDKSIDYKIKKSHL